MTLLRQDRAPSPRSPSALRTGLAAATLSLVAWASASAQLNPAPVAATADAAASAGLGSAWYTLHYQATVIDQGHSRFHAPYSGTNSQSPNPESANSITSTIFLGLRPRPGTEIFVNPELAGGRGMSSTLGIAGFTNGEIYRVGDPRPTILTARLYAKQVFGFGEETESQPDGQNQFAQKLAARRLTFVAGKFSLADFFDDNGYSHDPRSQFMNWALMSSIAWDYPADTRGYTWGLMTEYHAPSWALRGAAVAEPKVANQMDMDRRIGRAHGFAVEGEHSLAWGERKGAARLLAFLNEARMGSYYQSLSLAQRNGTQPDITKTEAYGHSKWGFASSDEMELGDHWGGFLRLSLDDGRNETWAFAEVDRSAALGVDWTAVRLGRPKDHLGIAQVVDDISRAHHLYLASGGNGFMLGDGALHFGPELITEAYYKIQANDYLAVSPDAQFVVNPGYNRARGPIPVWGVRVHAEF